MSPKKPIQVADKHYESITEFCKQNGLAVATVNKMRKSGMSFQEILEKIPVKASTSTPVMAEGHQFSSVLQFCEHYGLKYPAVICRIKNGEDGDSILQTLFSSSSSKRAKVSPCVVNGEEYPSIFAAAEAIGIPAWKVYYVKNISSLSASEAIQKVLDMTEIPDEYRGRQKCIVAGKEYKSQREAVAAYGTKLSTVTTRMQRFGISFEDALLQWRADRTRIVGAKSVAWDFSELDIGKQVPVESLPEDSKISQIGKILEKFEYNPRFYEDLSNEACWISHINPVMNTSDEPLDVYILCDENSLSRDIEVVSANLYTLDANDPAERVAVLEAINEDNGKYIGVRTWIKGDTVCASSSYLARSKTIVQATFMKMLCRLFGTADMVRQSLKTIPESKIAPFD